MAKAVAGEDQIIQSLPAIISWMEAMGISARNTRYGHYEKIINQFYRDKVDPWSAEGKQRFKDLSLAYRECIDIYLVYKCFEGVIHPNFISTLSKVVAGREVPDLEVAGESRNFLFELMVAARFKMAGYDIDFDDTSDVVAKRGGLVVRVECKRIVSEKQLYRRVNHAAKQLTTAMTKANAKVVGIVYIDISSCVLPGVRQIVETDADAEHEVKAAVHSFLARNANVIEALNRKHIDVSYATCLIGTLPIWSHDFVLHTSTATEVRAAETLSDEKYELLQNVLIGFDETLTRLF